MSNTWTDISKTLKTEDNIQTIKKDKKFDKFYTIGGLVLVAALGSYMALDAQQLTTDTVKGTIDQTMFHYANTSVFKTDAQMREHILNVEIKKHPNHLNQEIIFSGETDSGAEKRVKIIAQEKADGLFDNPIKFQETLNNLQKNVDIENRNRYQLAHENTTPDIRSKMFISEQIQKMRIDKTSPEYQGKLKYD